jgi:anti-sigma-K factor RskA
MSVHEQAAGFVLDALDGEEAREFERHLRVCPDCEDALEPLRLAAVALAFAGELPHPHPELRLRVLDVGGVVLPFRRRWTTPLLSAGAAAAACVAVVVGLHRFSGGTQDLSVGGMRAFAVQGADGTLLVADTREAVLVVRGLPSPAAGTAYELWIVRRGRPIAAGFLHGQVARLTRPIPPGAAVAVSLEPADGSRRPTGPLLLRAETA